MANPNGAANAGLYAATAGLNGMPAAGHYSDMQTLMQNMETLSGWLQQNREDFVRVQEGLEHVERRNARHPAGAVNGDTAQPLEDPHAPTISSLHRALDSATSTIASLESSHEQQLRLQSLYEDTLTEATERIRNYVFQQNEYIVAVHKHYASLLATSRQETMAAQQVHMDWQAGLGRLNEEMKSALEARERERSPYRKRLAGLREENALLRKMVGWEAAPAEEDEEDELGVGEQVPEVPRGRDERVEARRADLQRDKVLMDVMGASR